MKNKNSAFYIIAISLPFVFLLLLEVGLRLVGYGHSYPLFVEVDSMQGYVQPNPELIKRYFPANSPAPNVAPDTYFFQKDKPANTFRIVTMGGSTMAGFPYGRFGSPAGMLKQRLKATNPSQNIEVISVAMSSINSYTLLDITDEVIAINPDAVLIYAGHNEYLGIMGVGSVFASKGGHAANVLYLTLKDVRIFQLLQNILYFFSSSNIDTSNADQRTVMAQVAKNKDIVFNDSVYQAGVNQFRSNLDMILAKLNQADVNTLISNLVANELDQPPFNSISDTVLDNVAANLLNPATQSRTPVTAADISKANDILHADYFYAVGKRYAAANDAKNALGYLTRAADLDLLRFRAPSEFNQIIGKLSNKHRAIFVDMHAYFRQYTPLIGNNYMLEHLHPNDQGYFIMAEAFFEALVSEKLIQVQYNISEQTAKQLTAVTSADKMLARFKIDGLTSDYPFTDTKRPVNLPVATTAVEQIGLARITGAEYLETQQALLAYYQQANEPLKAATAAANMFDAISTNADAARAATMLYLNASQFQMAKYYALKCVDLAPKNATFRLTLAQIYFQLGKQEESVNQLNTILQFEPDNQRALQIKRQIGG